jgi:anaerobic C4-dicarboxylate transporter
VKAQLGAALTDRIKKFDSFYEACKRSGSDLTDNQFMNMHLEAERIKDDMDKVIASRSTSNRSGFYLFLFAIAAFVLFAFIKANT